MVSRVLGFVVPGSGFSPYKGTSRIYIFFAVTTTAVTVGLSLPFRYFFRSGNIEHPGDKLFNTSVEVLPFDVSLKIQISTLTKPVIYLKNLGLVFVVLSIISVTNENVVLNQ